MQRLGCAEHVQAVAPAHLQIAQHDVEVPFVQTLDRLIPVRRFFDFVASGRERPGQPAPECVVIICDENATHEMPSPFS